MSAKILKRKYPCSFKIKLSKRQEKRKTATTNDICSMSTCLASPSSEHDDCSFRETGVDNGTFYEDNLILNVLNSIDVGNNRKSRLIFSRIIYFR